MLIARYGRHLRQHHRLRHELSLPAAHDEHGHDLPGQRSDVPVGHESGAVAVGLRADQLTRGGPLLGTAWPTIFPAEATGGSMQSVCEQSEARIDASAPDSARPLTSKLLLSRP